MECQLLVIKRLNVVIVSSIKWP